MANSVQKAIDDEEEPVPGKEENPLSFLDPKTKVGAAASGLVQGGTLGFGDELYGGISALANAFSPRKLSAEEEDRKADLDEVAPLSKEDEFVKDYKTNRDDLRASDAVASKAHPVIHGLAEAAGALAVPVPGGTVAKGLPAAAKALAYAKVGAPLGAAYGLGKSDADNIGDAALDTASGAALGGAGSAVAGPLIEAGVGPVSNLMNRAFARRANPVGRSAAVELAAHADAAKDFTPEGTLKPDLSIQNAPDRVKQAQMVSIGRSLPPAEAAPVPAPAQVDADQVAQVAKGSQLQKFWNQARDARLSSAPDAAAGPFGSPEAQAQARQTAARQLLEQAAPYRERGQELADRVVKNRQEDPVWSKRADREAEIRKAFGGPSTSVPEDRIRADILRSREPPVYDLSHEETPAGLRVTAKSPEGTEYGFANFEKKPDALKPQGTLVSPLRQRYGIGEDMYRHASDATGLPIESNPKDQLGPGKAFRRTVDLPKTPQEQQVEALMKDVAAEKAQATDDPMRRKLSGFLRSFPRMSVAPVSGAATDWSKFTEDKE